MTRRRDDEPTLAEAFSAGNQSALAELYDRWSPLVYSIALGSLGNVAAAEEVTQQVFTRAWHTRQSFDSTRSRLSAWLVGLTLNQIADTQAARSKPVEPRTQRTTATQMDNPVEPAQLAERLVLVDEVSRLDTIPQQVLRMALYDDLTHAQIAERTGQTPATVKSNIQRGLLNLRQGLEVQSDAY